MTGARATPAQIYSHVASLWHGAGAASPLDGLEAMLELMALGRGAAGPKALDTDAELTGQAWAHARAALTMRLHLPESFETGSRFAERSPGLIEQTRRAVAGTESLSEHAAQDFYAALLTYLVYAPQTGMRRTEIGHTAWPDYLDLLFKALLPARDHSQAVYVPFDSSGWLPLLLATSGWSVACEVRSAQVARIFALFAYLGGWQLAVRLGDALRRPAYLDGNKLSRFPSSAAVLTFGLRDRDEQEFDPYNRFPVRLHYGEGKQLAHMLAQTEGPVLAVVPEAFLFRATGGERDYKEFLVRRGVLSSVIRLPKGTFYPSSNVQCSLMVLSSGSRASGDVLLVDATDDLGSKAGRHPVDGAVQQVAQIVKRRAGGPSAVLATYDEIAANDFNLSVDRYVRSDEDREVAELLDNAATVVLGDIAEIIRPQSFPPDGSPPVQTFAEVGLQDIEPDGRIKLPAKRVEIDDHSLGKVLRQRLEPNDVLLSVRGRIGTAAMVETTDGDGLTGWLASQAFVIVRLRETSPISPLVLYRYLASPIAQAALRALATGANVPMISMGDVKKLRIMVPTAEEQARIQAEDRQLAQLRAQLRELEAEIDCLTERAWPNAPAAASHKTRKR